MKKNLILIILLFSILIAIPAGQSALSDGLTSYFSFEGNASDELGINNGTATSVSYSTSYGKINQGSHYDGSSSYISVPAYTVGSSWTISFWMNQTSGDTGELVARDESSGSRGMSTYMDSSGVSLAAFNTGGTYYDTGVLSVTHQGSWIHVVCIYESGVNLRIIVNNGTPRSVAVSGDSRDVNAITFGRRNYPGSNIYYTGNIDELGIWNRVLSTDEISQLYNSGAGLSYSELLPSASSNETEGRDAIITAFNESELVSSYSVSNDTQAVLRLVNGSQYATTFDYIISVGSKRYLLNYEESDLATFANIANISPSIYVWQNKNMLSSTITSSVNDLINQTLG